MDSNYRLIDGVPTPWGSKMHILLPFLEENNIPLSELQENAPAEYVSWCHSNPEGTVRSVHEIRQSELDERLCENCIKAAEKSNKPTPEFVRLVSKN